MKKIIFLSAIFAACINFAEAQWQKTNGPFGGAIKCVAVCGNSIFAGFDGGGIYRSDNNGASWIEVNNGLTNFVINDIEVSGTDIFAGTNGGVFLSSNNGINWTAVSPTFGVNCLAIMGTSIFAGTNWGVYLSTNNGINWSLSDSGMTAYNTNIFSLAVMGTDIFAGSYNNVIYFSSDGGISWQTRYVAMNIAHSLLAFGGYIFLGTDNLICKSSDKGINWTVASNGIPSNTKILALSSIGTEIFAGTPVGVYVSSDTGANWTAANNGLTNFEINSFAANGSDIFTCTNNGLFVSSNSGSNWTGLNNGLPLHSISYMESIGSNIFAGSYSEIFRSDNKGSNWTLLNPGFMYKIINALLVKDSVIFAGTHAGLYKSNDNGITWVNLNIGIHADALAKYGQNIYALSSGGVAISSDNGATWASFSGPSSFCGMDNIAVIGPNILVTDAGSMNTIAITNNNGLTWTYSSVWIDSKINFAVIGNNVFAGADAGVLISSDFGSSWTAINTGLTSLNIYELYACGTNLFAATDSGVFLTSNNGLNWTNVSAGLPNNIVHSFTVSGADIYAGTAYNGVWKRPMSDFNITSFSFSGNVFNDINNNGIKEAGENGIPNMIIKSNVSNWLFNSDANGDYTAYSYLPNDTITLVNPYLYATVSPQSYIVTASDTGKNFAIYYTPNVQDLRITITNLTPARPGFDDVIQVTYQNLGTDTMSGTVTLDFPDNYMSYKSSNPVCTAINGNILTWNYTNLLPLEQRNMTATFTIFPGTPINTVLIFAGIVYPVANDIVPSDNANRIIQSVTGSFDPNDKEVIPDDGLTPQDLANGDKLVYTIHFQNTGTDTAFNIKITDTLSAKVDAGTFELLSSSHPCTFNMKGAGIVDFVFNNIFLPDSNVNLVGSNGFVKYAVKPLSTLLLGDSVTNTAYIYFDFNSPVQTNTASSLIHLPVGIAEVLAEDEIYIYPNPASSLISIELASVGAQNLVPTKTSRCRVYDILGTEVINKTFTGNKFNLDVSKLAKGLYLLRIEDDERIIVRSFVKE